MTPPLSNHITQAAAEFGSPSVVIRSDGTPVGTDISLTTGVKLGLVQSINWELTLGDVATCVVTVKATPGEFKALTRDTEMRVIPASGYHPLRYLWDWYATKAWLWWTKVHKPAPDQQSPTSSSLPSA